MLILVRNSLHETLWVGGFKSQAEALFVLQGGKKTRNEGNKSEVGNMIVCPRQTYPALIMLCALS